MRLKFSLKLGFCKQIFGIQHFLIYLLWTGKQKLSTICQYLFFFNYKSGFILGCLLNINLTDQKRKHMITTTNAYKSHFLVALVYKGFKTRETLTSPHTNKMYDNFIKFMRTFGILLLLNPFYIMYYWRTCHLLEGGLL